MMKWRDSTTYDGPKSSVVRGMLDGCDSHGHTPSVLGVALDGAIKPMTEDAVAYAYWVIPDKPEWADSAPAFIPFHQVTFEHPDERLGGLDGVTWTGIKPLTTDD